MRIEYRFIYDAILILYWIASSRNKRLFSSLYCYVILVVLKTIAVTAIFRFLLSFFLNSRYLNLITQYMNSNKKK